MEHLNMAYEVVDDFEQRTKPSRYAVLADGRAYKVQTKEFGHRSEKNLSMALRSFAKRHKKRARIQTGDGYVIVNGFGCAPFLLTGGGAV
jgi:hypothetical protein